MKVEPADDIQAPLPLKIISGGQTGADRAALDWAMDRGIPHGGWCPRGRLAEDGRIPVGYDLRSTPGSDYAQRTAWNVRDADVTLLFSVRPRLTGGSAFTAEVATNLGKPWLHLPRKLGLDQAAAALRQFLSRHAARVVNLAGPRSSQEPDVADWVRAVLDRTFPRSQNGPAEALAETAAPASRRSSSEQADRSPRAARKGVGRRRTDDGPRSEAVPGKAYNLPASTSKPARETLRSSSDGPPLNAAIR